MDKFFRASSVAVVGVSNSPSNLGRAMVYNLMEFRYEGCIYLVGPQGGSFLGHKIHTNILDIPDEVDLATILIPAAAVPEALRQCGEKGIKRVVLQSAGFRELGDARLRLEEEITSILKRYRMRLIGPNCIGIINRHTGLAVPFMPFRAEAPPGQVAIISQSGGVGAMMVNTLAAEHMGFSKFVSVGNKLNVDEADLLEYFVGDEQSRMVFCYLEGIADGRRLMEIAGGSSKPIIAHKSNKGGAGAIIARSHSASLSTDDVVVSAAFRQCGIVRVAEQSEAAECLKALALPRMGGNRLAVISRSGGHAVMAADAADDFGFTLPAFPDETLRLVGEHSRAKVIQFHNPMDLGDLFDLQLYRLLAEITLARDDIDGLLFVYNYQGVFDAESSRKLLASLGEVMAGSRKPLALCVFSTASELAENRRVTTFPIFTDPREAVRALARNRDWQPLLASPFARQQPVGVDHALVQAELAEMQGLERQLPPGKVARVLSAWGIPVIPWEQAESAVDAVAAAERLGFPVVMKTANPEIVHKSDVGGVRLNLADAPAVRDAYCTLEGIGGPAVLVMQMAEPGLEWFVGGRQDQHFGSVVVVGMGGIYVEIFRQTTVRVAPIDHDEALRMLGECRGAAVLAGARGQAGLDRDDLADLVVRVSWLLHDFPEIRQLDLNPVRIFAAGQGCRSLDWRATFAHRAVGT